MSGADLREFLIHALWVADGGPGWTVANVSDAERCQAERRESLYGLTVDRIIAAMPEAPPLAILNLIGDVREGWLTEHPLGWFVATGEASADATVPVFVVHPRGEGQ